jgi:hypothetical protein
MEDVEERCANFGGIERRRGGRAGVAFRRHGTLHTIVTTKTGRQRSRTISRMSREISFSSHCYTWKLEGTGFSH